MYYRTFRRVLLGILTVQVLMVVGLIVFSAFSTRYLQNFLKLTAVGNYRDDVDLQNFVDWVQVGNSITRSLSLTVTSYLSGSWARV